MVDSTNLPEVDINQIATDLNNKMDKDGVNATASVCVESWHDENGNWYRVYSDGWCEQGGTTNGASNITFIKSYANTNYTITSGLSGTGSSGEFPAFNKTISGFTVSHTYVTSNNFMWRACGYIR